jgi:hypothetical protein
MPLSDDENERMVTNSWTSEVRVSLTGSRRRLAASRSAIREKRRSAKYDEKRFLWALLLWRIPQPRPPPMARFPPARPHPQHTPSLYRPLTRCATPPSSPRAPQEDALLHEQIKRLGGPGNWTAIAGALVDRSSKSCRLRWVVHPSPPRLKPPPPLPQRFLVRRRVVCL